MAKITAADTKLVTEIVTKFKETNNNYASIRKNATADVKFFTGKQSDGAFDRAAAAGGNEPRLQVNRLPTKVQQVESNLRQMNVSIAIHPNDEHGSEELAEVYQGLIRAIEQRSNAKSAYVSAFGRNGALVPGFGFVKLNTKYCNDHTLDQEIIIEEVKNPFKVLPDFGAQKSDFSDAEYWFEFDDLEHDVFKQNFPKSNYASANTFVPIGAPVGRDWCDSKTIRVCKYWYKQVEHQTLALFEDGQLLFVDGSGNPTDDEDGNELQVPMIETSDDERAEWIMSNPDVDVLLTPTQRAANIERTREVEKVTIHWVLTNGMEVLDRGEWHDSEFPFVGFTGVDQIIDGKRDIHGIIRYVKDAQKMLNFHTTEIAKACARANKNPWQVSDESVPENYRKYYEMAHIKPIPMLPYKGKDSMGNPNPPPVRADLAEPAIQAHLAACQKFIADIDACFGFADPGIAATTSAGQQQMSGIALQTLAQQGELSNYHFSDNFVMALKRLGQLLIRLIPHIYDTPRTVQIVGADDEAEIVAINRIFRKNGKNQEYRFDEAGEYSVTVDTGPSFASKKAQQSESMIKFMGVLPPNMQGAIVDLVAGNLDWDTAKIIKERLQMVQAMNGMDFAQEGDLENLPSEAKAIIGKLLGQVKQQDATIEQLNGAYKQEKFKNDANMVNNSGKERIEMIKMYGRMQEQREDAMFKAQQTQNEAELEQFKAYLKHTSEKQKIILSTLKSIDKASGVNDQELYQQMANMGQV